MAGGRAHQTQQRAPIDRAAAGEMARPRIEQPQFVGANDHETGFIQTAPASATEHLQDFIRLEQLLGFVAAIGFGGQHHTSQREVDARGESHRGDDHAQLARLGQRFDDPCPRAIA